jgi:hypothetical protein
MRRIKLELTEDQARQLSMLLDDNIEGWLSLEDPEFSDSYIAFTKRILSKINAELVKL